MLANQVVEGVDGQNSDVVGVAWGKTAKVSIDVWPDDAQNLLKTSSGQGLDVDHSLRLVSGGFQLLSDVLRCKRKSCLNIYICLDYFRKKYARK